MKRIFILLLTFSIGPFAPVNAQTYADASLTLKQAAHEELVTGDIDRAISLYLQVSESVSASRENVAKALIALGNSYEMIGSSEAISTYQRIVAEFSDQPEAFLSAHNALNRLSGQGGGGGGTAQLVIYLSGQITAL